MKKLGRNATTIKADLGSEKDTVEIVARAAKDIGPLTALVNSASLFENDDWQSVTRESWDNI